MKKVFFSLLLTLFAVSMMAQKHLENHFILGASFEKTTENPKEASIKFRDYWELDLRAAYKFYIVKQIYVAPELSLMYNKHKISYSRHYGIVDPFLPSVADASKGQHAYGIGLGFAPKIGYTLPIHDISSWDIYTGPSFKINVDQHQHNRGEYWSTAWEGDKIRRASLFWNFGAAYRLHNVSIFGEYNLRMTRLIKFKDSASYGFGSNTFSVGVAYNF